MTSHVNHARHQPSTQPQHFDTPARIHHTIPPQAASLCSIHNNPVKSHYLTIPTHHPCTSHPPPIPSHAQNVSKNVLTSIGPIETVVLASGDLTRFLLPSVL